MLETHVKEVMPQPRCPVCDSLTPSRPPLFQREFGQIIECTACGLWILQSPSSNMAKQKAKFDPGWFRQSRFGFFGWRNRVRAEQRMQRLRRFIGNAPRRILEVGPGTGHALQYLKSHGHDVQGVELSEELASELQKGCELPIAHGGIDAATGSFDVVMSFHVLEHTEDPVAFAQAMLRLTKPGGYVVNVTPNTGFYTAHLAKHIVERYYIIPEHRLYFNVASAAALSSRLGARVELLTTTEEPEHRYYRSIQDRLPRIAGAGALSRTVASALGLARSRERLRSGFAGTGDELWIVWRK